MSKVICEICGTAYPDTEKECPVCGFEKPETAEFVPEDTAGAGAKASGHVRGGRFSKTNVSRKQTAPAESGENRKSKPVKNGKSDTGLIIATILLLISVICLGAHIYVTYFAGAVPPVDDPAPEGTTTQPTQTQPTQTTPTQTQGTTAPVEIACTGLTLHEQSVVLNEVGSQWLLSVVPTPANTTDPVTYSSADQNIAIVNADGQITAVAEGETVITVTCGSVSVECKVVCKIAEETEPQETEPKETESQDIGDFKLNREDFTLVVGESWRLYNGTIDADEISWRSSNSSVATVSKGRVKGVAPGYAWITAEYKGVELKCIVYVINP